LYKLITKHLPESTVKMVMRPIFKVYKEQWGKAFGDVILGSEDSQKRMLRDVEYFNTRLGGLDGAGDIGEYIVKLVKEKSVPRPKPIPEPRTQPETNGKASFDVATDAGGEKSTEKQAEGNEVKTQ